MNVDVVIPVRNGERYISHAIQSVLNQTYAVARIIVVNDGSTDGTALIAGILSAQHDNVEIICTPPLGLSNARNTGLSLATSDWVSFLDCDDVWLDTKIYNQIQHVWNHTTCAAVFSGYYFFDEKTGQRYPGKSIQRASCSKNSLLFHQFKVFGSASNILVKRKVALKAGFFDLDLSYGEDLDYWVRLSEHTEICQIDESDVVITLRPGSMQSTKQSGIQSLKNSVLYLRIWEKHDADFSDRLNLETAKALLWPDLRLCIKNNPRILREFRNLAKQECPKTYAALFKKKGDFYKYIFFAIYKDLIKQLKKWFCQFFNLLT